MKLQFQDDVTAYLQKQGQCFKEYQLNIQSLMRLRSYLSNEEKLERIYNNCRQEYNVYVKCHEFKTLSELKAMAEKYEVITGCFKSKYKERK